MTQKIDGIINSLSELESDIDSVNLSLVDMKKSLNSIAQKEIDSLLEQTRKMATSEAESMISESKSKAESESQKITQNGEAKIAEIQQNIDSSFDSAVENTVSTILKS
jgi:V/A-type H+-transporting ATPase subunit G/H|tara:strand:+ start:219 stop:542 length:324 start_codon:yes stop_codon:yes gene_type:complete